MLKKVKTDKKSPCFLKIQGKCPICGMILGDCIIEDEKGKRNLGYHKYQQSSICISSEEINSLPECLCKSCKEKTEEMEAA